MVTIITGLWRNLISLADVKISAVHMGQRHLVASERRPGPLLCTEKAFQLRRDGLPMGKAQL
jgi:hypothetical protein